MGKDGKDRKGWKGVWWQQAQMRTKYSSMYFESFPTIPDHFGTSENHDSEMDSLSHWKHIIDDGILYPKGHPSLPREIKNLWLFWFWPYMMSMDSNALGTWEMSSYWREYLGVEDVFWLAYIGMQDVFLLDRSRWIWKMSSCRRWPHLFHLILCLYVMWSYLSYSH